MVIRWMVQGCSFSGFHFQSNDDDDDDEDDGNGDDDMSVPWAMERKTNAADKQAILGRGVLVLVLALRGNQTIVWSLDRSSVKQQ